MFSIEPFFFLSSVFFFHFEIPTWPVVYNHMECGLNRSPIKCLYCQQREISWPIAEPPNEDQCHVFCSISLSPCLSLSLSFSCVYFLCCILVMQPGFFWLCLSTVRYELYSVRLYRPGRGVEEAIASFGGL